jgi:hypothetical protein
VHHISVIGVVGAHLIGVIGVVGVHLRGMRGRSRDSARIKFGAFSRIHELVDFYYLVFDADCRAVVREFLQIFEFCFEKFRCDGCKSPLL